MSLKRSLMEWILTLLETNYRFICSMQCEEKYKSAVINSWLLLCSGPVVMYQLYI